MHIDEILTAQKVINEIYERMNNGTLNDFSVNITPKHNSNINWQKEFHTTKSIIKGELSDVIKPIVELIHNASINSERYKHTCKYVIPESAEFMQMQESGYIVDLPKTKEIRETGANLVALIEKEHKL